MVEDISSLLESFWFSSSWPFLWWCSCDISVDFWGSGRSVIARLLCDGEIDWLDARSTSWLISSGCLRKALPLVSLVFGNSSSWPAVAWISLGWIGGESDDAGSLPLPILVTVPSLPCNSSSRVGHEYAKSLPVDCVGDIASSSVRFDNVSESSSAEDSSCSWCVLWLSKLASSLVWNTDDEERSEPTVFVELARVVDSSLLVRFDESHDSSSDVSDDDDELNEK